MRESYVSKNEIERDVFEAGWRIENGALAKQYVFKNFIEVIDFLNILWSFFEEAHHHPDFTVQFNRISFTIRSHEKNAITEKDYVLAELIENVYLCLTDR